jgi:hypothetical protein
MGGRTRVPARMLAVWLTVACGIPVVLYPVAVSAGDEPTTKPTQADAVSEARREILETKARSIVIASPAPGFPAALEPRPLFRYDDQTRGYVDGFVWKLGAKGRPLAIVTNELHPDYLGGGKRMVFDYLSLTDQPFNARSAEVAWSPRTSAVEFQPIPDAPVPADTPAARLPQIKALARRFDATQEVAEQPGEKNLVRLRLLPKEIDRYAPTDHARSDGAVFLLVNGRNPGLVLLIETDGEAWSFGVGRQSMPSTFRVQLSGAEVWTRPPGANSDGSYTATNAAVPFP